MLVNCPRFNVKVFDSIVGLIGPNYYSHLSSHFTSLPGSHFVERSKADTKLCLRQEAWRLWLEIHRNCNSPGSRDISARKFYCC